MTEKYLFLDGVKRAAKIMEGNEKIHMGIRPYEMHAGNSLALVVYPILLCQELVKLGKKPKLQLILSLNDWEQSELIGENIYHFQLDVKPKDTTIQYAHELNGTPTPLFWGNKITLEVSRIKKLFPEVVIKPVYNSSLIDSPIMKSVLFKTIDYGEQIKLLMLKASGLPTNNTHSKYANALCPNCHHANTNSKIIDSDTLEISCQKCGLAKRDSYENFSYWLHHKPLFAARWKIFDFQYSLSGGDHFLDGDAEIRTSLYKFFFNESPPNIGMLFSPILLGNNGKKMSKSRNNYFSCDISELLTIAQNNDNKYLSVEDAYVKSQESINSQTRRF